MIQREYLLSNTNKIVLFGSETELITAFKENRLVFAEFVKQQYDKNVILDLENYFKTTKKTISEIEMFLDFWVQNDLLLIENGEKISEELMTLNRNERNFFSFYFFHFIDNYKNNKYNRILHRHFILNNIAFSLLYYPEKYSKNEIRKYMFIAAEGFALYNKYLYCNSIAIGINENRQFEILHTDFSDNKRFKSDELKLILEHLGWFDEKILEHFKITEKK